MLANVSPESCASSPSTFPGSQVPVALVLSPPWLCPFLSLLLLFPSPAPPLCTARGFSGPFDCTCFPLATHSFIQPSRKVQDPGSGILRCFSLLKHALCFSINLKRNFFFFFNSKLPNGLFGVFSLFGLVPIFCFLWGKKKSFIEVTRGDCCYHMVSLSRAGKPAWLAECPPS